MDFVSELKKIAGDVESVLDEMIPSGEYSTPSEAGRYAALDAGKRLRTFLTAEVGRLFDAPYEALIRAGAVIEMVHNFSLIHDDMPCMDNDKLRRGRPSVWAKYGEWQALLAGDFLANFPFKILATDTHISADAAVRLRLVEALATATDGMIMGQWMDLMAETGRFRTAPEIDELQRLKTGAIFSASARFGMILGRTPPTLGQADAIERYIENMGICFQITDDILDACGDESKVGKTLRKDDGADKATYVSLLGLDGARKKAAELSAAAKDALNIFDERADGLRALVDFMITREA